MGVHTGPPGSELYPAFPEQQDQPLSLPVAWDPPYLVLTQVGWAHLWPDTPVPTTEPGVVGKLVEASS